VFLFLHWQHYTALFIFSTLATQLASLHSRQLASCCICFVFFLHCGVKRNFWLHTMCACTEWYSTCKIRWENWWL